MSCFLCKGNIQISTTTYMTDRNNHYIIIKNVPCFKCEQCGDELFSETVVKKLERIFDTLPQNPCELSVTIIDYTTRII